MSHVISMHRPGDLRQTAVSDLPKVILCLMELSFEHSTLIVRAKQHNHSAVAAPHWIPQSKLSIDSEKVT
jgi:hypothetical protein